SGDRFRRGVRLGRGLRRSRSARLALRRPALRVLGIRRAGGRPARPARRDVRAAVGRPVRPDAVHRRDRRPTGARVRPGHRSPAHRGGGNRRADPGVAAGGGGSPPRSAGRARRVAGGGPVSAGPPPEGWQRLHPLSPVVRGGRATIAVAFLLLPIAFGADSLSNATPQLVITGLLVLAGFVSWLVTRWRIEDDDLRIETGLLRR